MTSERAAKSFEDMTYSEAREFIWETLSDRIFDRWRETTYEVSIETGKPATTLVNADGYVQDQYVSAERLTNSILPVIDEWMQEFSHVL